MGDTVDPAMMGALMSACSLINAGAGTEEVSKLIKDLKVKTMDDKLITIPSYDKQNYHRIIVSLIEQVSKVFEPKNK